MAFHFLHVSTGASSRAVELERTYYLRQKEVT